MDKYSKRSIARLWIALAVLMVLCTTTETFAQSSAATDRRDYCRIISP